MGPDLKWDGVSEFYVWKDSLYVYMMYIYIYVYIYNMYIVCFIGRDSKNGLLPNKIPGNCFLSAFFFFVFVLAFFVKLPVSVSRKYQPLRSSHHGKVILQSLKGRCLVACSVTSVA